MDIIFVLLIVFLVSAAVGAAVWYITDQEARKMSASTYEEHKAECDAKLEESRVKYEKMVRDGVISREEATASLQAEIDATNAKLMSIQAELEGKAKVIQENENKIRDLENKKICARIAGVRKAGAGFLEGDSTDEAANYGMTATLEECEQSCKNDLECKQFVWWKGDNKCFPLKKEYENGTLDPNFVSGSCGA